MGGRVGTFHCRRGPRATRFLESPRGAATPATQRAIRNLNSVFASVTLLPELRTAVPAGQEQTAKNLLRDLETACQRGERELGGIPEADNADPAVTELAAKLQTFQAFRDDLKKAIEGGAATSAANDAASTRRPASPSARRGFRSAPGLGAV